MGSQVLKDLASRTTLSSVESGYGELVEILSFILREIKAASTLCNTPIHTYRCKKHLQKAIVKLL